MMLNGYATKLVRVAGLVVLAACSGSEASTPQSPPPVPTDRLTVSLTLDRDSILFGTTRQYQAKVVNQLGIERSATVDWSSTNAEVASVTSNGLVTAIGAGSMHLIVGIAGSADTALVTVYGSAVALQIVPNAVNLSVGDDITLQATLSDSTAGMGGQVEWTTSDSTLATVASDGTVTGHQAGDVTLTASLAGSTAEARVIVEAAPVATVILTPTVNSITTGGHVNLKAYAKSATGAAIEGAKFSWSSSDTSVATVNAQGVVSGKSRGYSILSASAQGKRGSVSVNVGPSAVGTVVATLPDSSLLEGQVAQAAAVARDASGKIIAGATIAWQSQNPAIATVTSTGRVTGIVAGNVNITALSGGKTSTIPVVVATRLRTTLTVTPTAPTLALGTTATLAASVLDQNGQPMGGVPVTWAASNSAIVSVSSAGVITGVTSGQSDITAAAGTLHTTVRVTVGAAPVATVAVSPATATVTVGDQPIYSAVLKDPSGNVLSGRVVTWSSSNPSVVTISASGVATTLATGSSTITATSEGQTGTATLTVDPLPPPPVATVTVTLNASTLDVGQNTQGTALVLDSQGLPTAGSTVTWSSSDASIATVSQGGVVSAVSGGTTTILASSNGVTGAATITVNAAAPASVASISVSLTPATLGAGATSQAAVTLRDAAGNVLVGRSYGLSSDKPNIATVNTSGLVMTVAAGVTNIRATSGTKMGFKLLTVTSGAPVVASVSVTAASTLMNIGDTQPVTATALDAGGNTIGGVSFTYVSSAPAIITAAGDGTLTAIAAGSATITATTAGVSGTLGVTVQNAPPAAVATVQVTLAASSIPVGQTSQGTAVLKDAAGNVLTGRTVAWSSSNTAAATVGSNGLVSGVAAGTPTITASSGGITGSAPMTITAPALATVTPVLASSTLSVGQTTTTTTTLKDALGGVMTGIPVTYSSSNSTVATVNSTGMVTAIAAGSANIVATALGISGTASLTVQAPLPVAGAQLPRAVPSIPAGLGSLPCTVNVPAGGLQLAITQSHGGSVLCLTGTHTGNFTVPARTDAGWVVIRSAGTIPAGRMRPSNAGGLAKLESKTVLPALQFSSRSVRTLVLGLEITSIPTMTTLAPVSLVQVGTGSETNLSDLATDIAFQQLYVHGWAGAHIRRGFTLNGAAQTIKDSWCDEIHASGYDSQCSVSWNSSGPILIENNTLMAASENIMFGGADPKIAGLVTSDITIRRNHVAKNIAWKGGNWNVKNLIETKSSARVLVEENVLEGSWTDGQVGYAFVLKSTTQNGGCRACGTSDWTIRRNLIQNAGAGFSIAGRADQNNTGPTDSTNRRFDISENWIGALNVSPYVGDGRPIIFLAENHDFTVRRNVFEGGNANSAMLFDIASLYAVRNLTVNANVLARGTYGMFATATGEGNASWTKAALGSSSWTAMAMVGSTAAKYPTGTTWYSSVTSALNSGAGVARGVIDAGIQGVVVSP
ncbi:MAG: Ig-like domain-containing protein [Cytophagaceae bacterium]|nr:Ig-like domain-containing protein [Gemmatimonadaceae bacterium]